MEVTRAYAQALIVDRGALAQLQETNDAYLAAQTLKRAFTTEVSPILAEARRRQGGAIDPVATYRASGYRDRKANERPTTTAGGGGIV
jgi:L-rhamnose isomerase/sugar isomerase